MPRALTENDGVAVDPDPVDSVHDVLGGSGRRRHAFVRAPSALSRTASRSTICTIRAPRPTSPGGPRTVCLALTTRIHELLRMAVPDDERDGPTEEGVDHATIDRLAASMEAASMELVEPAETVN